MDDTETEARLSRHRHFELTGARVGDGRLLEARHRATGLRFVLIPGGSFEMGFAAEEMQEAIRTLGVERGPGLEVYRSIFESVYRAARPTTHITVQPMLFARHPLPDARVDSSLRGRAGGVPVREYFPDIDAWDDGFGAAESEDYGFAEDDLPDWVREERELLCGPGAEPALLRAVEVQDVVTQLPGLRLPSEAEWEFVARAGGARRWLDEPGVESRHPFGVWGLHFGTWVGDAYRATLAEPRRAAPSTPDNARGGAWSHYPFQDRAEAIDLHCAFRWFESPHARAFPLHLAADL